MVQRLAAIGCAATLLWVAATRSQTAAAQAPTSPAPARQPAPATMGPDARRALLDRYCVGCHNQKIGRAHV